jgi:hypothetical protein
MPDNFRPDPGQGLRDGRPQGHPGGHSGPRMQRPGGPG